jgi:hypothetical protein
MNLKKLFTNRAPEREILVVPVHNRINEEHWQAEVQTVLAPAATQAARSGLLWRWIRHDGVARLCRWDADGQVFLQGSLNDWILYFGHRWRVTDTTGQEFAGASPVVQSRLIEAVLADPDLPKADWALQLSRKRKALVK